MINCGKAQTSKEQRFNLELFQIKSDLCRSATQLLWFSTPCISLVNDNEANTHDQWTLSIQCERAKWLKKSLHVLSIIDKRTVCHSDRQMEIEDEMWGNTIKTRWCELNDGQHSVSIPLCSCEMLGLNFYYNIIGLEWPKLASWHLSGSVSLWSFCCQITPTKSIEI
jgi:hypothetical protein